MARRSSPHAPERTGRILPRVCGPLTANRRMIALQGIRPAMPLTTIRVLLVEDEIMIRMMVADMVEELGHVVAAEAGDAGRAAELAQTGLFDLAILDVNLNGTVS